MQNHQKIYSNLQRHLDRQAIGFPATRSGAEIRILKRIFTPYEAQIACHLNYRPESLEMIYPRVAHLVTSEQKLAQILSTIQRKGGLESKTRDGRTVYCIAPLVVGMYEMQVGRMTPEFLKDFDEYVSSYQFAISFLSTRLPQMRTIPISKSLRLQSQTSTFDEAYRLLQQSDPPFVLLECICREKKALEGHPCRKVDRVETCIAIGGVGETVLKLNVGRETSRSEVLATIEQNQKDGLVLQPSNTQKAEFICSCCGCCCGMLGLHQSLPRPLDYWSANFQAVVHAGSCNSCGACENRCQVNAISKPAQNKPAVVDKHLCIGCGQCVAVCPTEALSLRKKKVEFKPPQNREELNQLIMSGKKGALEKVLLTARLIFDAVRTGKTHLIDRRSRP